MAARRSPDPSAKHGCVLADEYHRVVAIGFNGFPRGMDDASMPRIGAAEAPNPYLSKARWIDHAEENALAVAALNGAFGRGQLTAYVSGQPCFRCAKLLVRHEILRWVVIDRPGNAHPEPGEAESTARLIESRGVKVSRLAPDLSFLLADDFVSVVRGVTRSQES